MTCALSILCSFVFDIHNIIRVFFYCLSDKHRPDALVSFVRLFKSYYQYDHLSSSRYRLLKFPETRLTTKCGQSVGRSFGPALIGQACKNTLFGKITYLEAHYAKISILLFLPARSKWLLRNPFSKILDLRSSNNVTGQFSHPHKTTGKV
jgi:hypothetical protein